jgi:hypothetical protein
MLSIRRFEPPPWWKDGMIDGLTWDELLAREWAAAEKMPKSERQLKIEAMLHKIGTAFAQQRTDEAIKILRAEE